MTAFELLKHIKQEAFLPMSTEKPCTEASNSELRRWLEKKSVVINGEKPSFSDTILFPITELVFFPKGNRRTTFI